MNNRSSKAVADFFSTMLDDKGIMEELQHQPLERLLAQVTSVEPQQEISLQEVDPALLLSNDSIEVIASETVVENSNQTAPYNAAQALQQELADVFPVLYFSVAEYTFAVPLLKLKGIYVLKEPTKLFGKPDWFSGIQVEREQNLTIVDTARYLMPDKFDRPLEHSTNYKYIIVLGDSNWGLKCDTLVDSDNLSQDQIKWRTNGKSIPWLAGTVKQRMCGLLAVDMLIELFDKNMTV